MSRINNPNLREEGGGGGSRRGGGDTGDTREPGERRSKRGTRCTVKLEMNYLKLQDMEWYQFFIISWTKQK